MAAGDLTTLDKVKGYLGLDAGDTTDDALLGQLISEQSSWFASRVGRGIFSASYTQRFNGNGGSTAVLEQYPVTAVASVTVDGTAVPAQSTATGDGWYLSNADAGVLDLVGYYFTSGRGNCSIAYTAGYAAVPADIEGVVIQRVAEKYRAKDHVGQQSTTLAGGQTVYFSDTISPATQAVINHYRRWSVA